MQFIERRISVRTLSEGVTILPFACVHFDHPGFHQSLFERFLQRARESPSVYTLGMGDYLDFARTHHRIELRRAIPGGDEDSQEHLDLFVADRADRFIECVRSIAPRCLGLIDGNHNWVFLSTHEERGWYASETLTAYIARKLKVPYLGYSTVIRMEFFHKGEWIDRYTIFASHGYGMGGATASADLGAMERKVEPAFFADCLITAHTHRRITYFLPEIDIVNGQIVERTHLLVKAGAFLKAYLPNRVTYAEKKLLRPTDLGWVEINIRWHRKPTGELKRLVTASMTRECDIFHSTDQHARFGSHTGDHPEGGHSGG
jgi:hypothetical protein